MLHDPPLIVVLFDYSYNYGQGVSLHYNRSNLKIHQENERSFF